MKKTVSIVVIVIVLLAVAWLVAGFDESEMRNPEQRVAPTENTVSFACDDGKSIVANYADNGGIVTLDLSDGRSLTLEGVVGASGTMMDHYENETGVIFWVAWDSGKGFVAESRETTYENCIVVGAESDSEDMEVVGTITNIDETQAMVDGPYVVEVAIEGGDDTARILIPSMGILLCEARDNIADISDLEEGMTVEARGAVSGDDGGSITPCESEDHYLRIVSE